MIDFTYLPTKKKAYGGANGSKLSVIYNNELYMLKLPMHALRNPTLSYTNRCTSEYLCMMQNNFCFNKIVQIFRPQAL